MKKLMPKKVEIAVFAVLSLILAAVAMRSASMDVLLAVFSIPLFVVSALLGMHRAGRLAPVPQEIRVEQNRR